ncbi:MAG: type II secretion system protein N [Thermodesulfobacteriota bacterium]
MVRTLWTALDVCLIAILSYWLVQISYRWLTETSLMQKEVSGRGHVAARVEEKAASPRKEPPAIQRSPFLPPSRNEASEKKTDGATGNLKLWGTITGHDGLIRAVIETEPDKRQHLVKIGEWIGSARVVEIHRDRVILLSGLQRQVLAMQQWRNPGPSVGVAPEPATPSSNSSTNRIAVKRTQIDEAIQNINALMKQVRIIPNFTDGKPDGLALSGVMTGSFFSSLGLQSGDILLGVDGKPIQSADDALKIYTGLKTANRLQLNIRRNGREEALEYAIE